jgi:hypothetical protein
VQKIEAQAKSDAQRLQAQTDAEVALVSAKSSVEAMQLSVQAEMEALAERQKSAGPYETHPSLLRLEELRTLRDLARNTNARLYLDFKRRPENDGKEE